MYVRNLVYPLHLQTEGPKTTFFDDFAKLTAYIFGTIRYNYFNVRSKADKQPA